jgi:hypothetical protein
VPMDPRCAAASVASLTGMKINMGSTLRSSSALAPLSSVIGQ